MIHLSRKLVCAFLAFVPLSLGCARRPDQAVLDKQLVSAVHQRNMKEIRRLLKSGASPTAQIDNGDSVLNDVANSGDADVMAALLDTKIDTKSLNEALVWAAVNEPLVVTMPAPKGVQIVQNHKIRSPDDDYTDVARLLLDHGAELEARDQEGATPLLRAAAHGETGVVKLLLDRGADLGERDNGGQTALNAASCDCPIIDQPETLDVMKLLLERGADIEARDKDGDTPLIHAADWGRTENVDFLLQKGAVMEATDNRGNSALSVAAEGGGYPTTETVKFLLEHGAKVEHRNNEGRTPLFLAVSGDGTDQIEIVKLLLGHGADVRSKDKHGDTVLDLAEKKHGPKTIPGTHAKLLKILRNAFAAVR